MSRKGAKQSTVGWLQNLYSSSIVLIMFFRLASQKKGSFSTDFLVCQTERESFGKTAGEDLQPNIIKITILAAAKHLSHRS